MADRLKLECKMSKFMLGVVFALTPLAGGNARVFYAGASVVDITPVEFPVKVAGDFFEAATTSVHDRLYARCLALDDGSVRAAVVVVDNCLISQEIFEQAKQIAHENTGIPIERMMMSATHTHSAPAAVGALGTDPDEKYCRFLPGRIAAAVELAVRNLTPARVGWTVVQDAEHTCCRRWIRRPDRISVDPFGRASVRAMMHPGHQNPDYLGPAGPVDTDLSLLSVRSLDGRPIAVLANYSMHYFGAQAISADYFGVFARVFAGLIDADPNFVAIMSQGTSGDLQWRDYGKPPASITLEQYAESVAQVTSEAYKKIEYQNYVQLAMAERKLELMMRPISPEDLSWAKQTVEKFKDRKPQSLPEVYAREQVLLDQAPPARQLKLQVLRVGGLGITAIPCEVFGITGLRIKAQSPLQPTFNIELANGYYGYLPPPQQHRLGGYTTWRARSAGLEVEAEPKIVACVLELLEEVAGRPRRVIRSDDCPFADYPKAVLASKPLAYWRCSEFDGPNAVDTSGNGRHGAYEGGVAFYLEGPVPEGITRQSNINRAPQLAGGCMKGVFKDIGQSYTVEMWFCNYLPVDARAVTGYLFACRGANGSDYIGICGTENAGGKLFFGGSKSDEVLSGKAGIPIKTWSHIAVVRDGRKVSIYLNGQSAPEISGESPVDLSSGAVEIFIGSRGDAVATFEGRVDEIAVFNRALSAEEIAGHYRAAGRVGTQQLQMAKF